LEIGRGGQKDFIVVETPPLLRVIDSSPKKAGSGTLNPSSSIPSRHLSLNFLKSFEARARFSG